MRKHLALLIIGVLTASIACSLTACRDRNGTEEYTGGVPSSPRRYSLGTSSSGGNFYLVGGGIATILNNDLPEYFVMTSEETGGSTANLTMIQNGDAELGICMTSSLAEAAAGADWTGNKPMDKVRGMIALYPSYMTMYALSNSNIHSITDFNNKIVGLGSKGAAMDSVLRKAFTNMNIAPSSIFNDGHGSTASAVSDGQVDAAVLFAYPPFSSITELEASKELTFISLSEEEQKKLTDMFPFYSPATLKAGSYKSMTEDVQTVSEWNMLVTSTAVPDEYVYLMTKTLLEKNPDMLAIHGSLVNATAENILNYNIPLHSGTIKYLKEVGIEVPDELIPPEYTE